MNLKGLKSGSGISENNSITLHFRKIAVLGIITLVGKSSSTLAVNFAGSAFLSLCMHVRSLCDSHAVIAEKILKKM